MSFRRCGALTTSGRRCRNWVRFPSVRCHIHRRVGQGVSVLLAFTAALSLPILFFVTGIYPELSTLEAIPFAIGASLASISLPFFVSLIKSSLRAGALAAEYRIANLAGASRAARVLLSELDDYQESVNGEDPAVSAPLSSGRDEAASTSTTDDDYRHTETHSGGNITVNFFNNRDSSQLAELVCEQSEGNAGLIIKYYTQGHRQASLTFILSMMAATAGFVIAAVAVISLIRNPHDVTTAVVTAVVSAVIDRIENRGADISPR